jgi:hypothetical protein
MAQQMISFRSRWLLGVGLTALICGIYWGLDQTFANGLLPARLISGLVLFAVILLLALFNARKKLPFLPLRKASVWLQIHIYAGLFAMALFLIHVHFKPPRGWLETALAVLFVAVSLSGVFGLAISRWIPARLALRGENVVFERIPALRWKIKQEVEALALASVPQTHSTTIADFYERRLRSYFERPHSLWGELPGYSKSLHVLLSEVEDLDRYLNAEERKLMAQIAEFIRIKENLDFQLAAQGLLKLWLFVHIPLSYALILIGLVHGILAWKFS